MQARVDRANGTGGGHRVLRNEPHARIQKPRTLKSQILKSQILRHGIIAFGSALWLAGLWAQFHSLSAAATYVVISLLMMLAVVATSARPVKRASSD